VLLLLGLTLSGLLPARAVLSQHRKPVRAAKKSDWQKELRRELAQLEARYPGQLGLYIKDLNSGEEFALNSDENWYLASTVKVPIAMAVLRLVDQQKLSLDTEVMVTEEDYVDGNGPLTSRQVGEKVSVRYLIEQMIILSDNMASDMLLRIAGLDAVNSLIRESGAEGFTPVTSLKDVRRQLYSELHSKALALSGKELLDLKRIEDPKERLQRLLGLLELRQEELKEKSIHAAYERYYEKGLNSGPARQYAKLLEDLWEAKTLSPTSRDFLLKTMTRTQTGRDRIRAGLKKPWVFAHKTGTQYHRIADVGFVWNPQRVGQKPLIVVSFVKGIPEEKASAKVMAEVARAISRSGVL
jgi:beta-lactamase class A